MAVCHGYVISWQESASFYITNIWSGNGFILYSVSVLFLFLGDLFSTRAICFLVGQSHQMLTHVFTFRVHNG